MNASIITTVFALVICIVRGADVRHSVGVAATGPEQILDRSSTGGMSENNTSVSAITDKPVWAPEETHNNYVAKQIEHEKHFASSHAALDEANEHLDHIHHKLFAHEVRNHILDMVIANSTEIQVENIKRYIETAVRTRFSRMVGMPWKDRVVAEVEPVRTTLEPLPITQIVNAENATESKKNVGTPEDISGLPQANRTKVSKTQMNLTDMNSTQKLNVIKSVAAKTNGFIAANNNASATFRFQEIAAKRVSTRRSSMATHTEVDCRL